MFVLCVLYSKDKKAKSQDNQDKAGQTKYRGREQKIPLGGESFCTCPDRPWGSFSRLYNGYSVSSPGVKRPGRGVNHPLHLAPRLKKEQRLYLYSLFGPSWPVLWANFTSFIRAKCQSETNGTQTRIFHLFFAKDISLCSNTIN